jgi:hypothetical protein
LEGKEVIGISTNHGRAGLETGEDGKGLWVGVIGPSEAAVHDGIDGGEGEADRAFVFHHDDVVQVELCLGDVAKADESGIGLDRCGAVDEDRVAGIVVSFQWLGGKQYHFLREGFQFLE